MSTPLPDWLAQAWLIFVAISLVWVGRHLSGGQTARTALAVEFSLVVLAIVSRDGRLAFAALAAAGGVLAWTVRRTSITAAVYLLVSALLLALAATTVGTSGTTLAFAASLAAIAVRAGLFPLHSGVASLAKHSGPSQVEQLASLPALVFVHLRFVDHGTVAFDLAPIFVGIGGASTLLFALISLVQRDLRRLYVASTLMHGGMLFAAVGAAGRGHYSAAILVTVTMVLALAGFNAMISALEARIGVGDVPDFVGRARAFPRLATALALFGGAAVGLPGTAGFVADDLLLHALWEESVGTAVAVVVASALLAVATLATFSRVMLGPPKRHLASDLQTGERRVVVLLMILLITLGFVPRLLVSPVNALLQ